MTRRVVVTGGAGFIGANLCKRLLEIGVPEVIALDDLSTGSRANLDDVSVELVVGSILDAELLVETFRGADSIVHLAARPSVPRSLADPVASHLVNATGTLNVLETARQEQTHTVVASSSAVYGANPTLPKAEDLRCMPMSPYAVSKLATESYATAYRQCFQLPTLALRFFNVYGPLQTAGHAYAAVIPAFVDAALARRPLQVHGDGNQSRDFTYVGTVTEALATAAVHRIASPDPINLAFGTRTTLLDLIRIIEREVRLPVTVEHQEPRIGDVHDSQASDVRLRALLPAVEPVDLEHGIRETVEWFRSGRASTGSPHHMKDK